MNKKNNYIWLFGENLSNTANNNSFYFWKHIVNKKKEDINKYIILKKNKANEEIYKSLNDKEKKSVVWRNSLKKNKYVTIPTVYLQHGVTAIKKLGYRGFAYNNNMLRFIYYNKNIKQQLKSENDFRDYQLFYGEYMPRWKELVQRYEKNKKDKGLHKISWFLTWREYLGNNLQTDLLVRKIRSVLNNKKLIQYLSQNNIKMQIVLHQFFLENKFNILKDVKDNNISIVSQKEIDVMQSIVDADLLITDYSSIGFDATFLNKPVIMFFPDIDQYLEKRSLYCTIDELKSYGITSVNELVNSIIYKKYGINDFYRTKLPNQIDFNYIKSGKHIDRMYNYFKKMQKNKITFVGYNFYGVGGTVSATRSLAEGLLEKGYMVNLLSLKKVGNPKKLPYGLNMKYIYDSNSKEMSEKIKKSKIIWNFKKAKYLNSDPAKEYLVPYAEYALKKALKSIKSNTVVSTRESLHQFIIDANSNKINNKIYFYHCQSALIDELFPGVIQNLKKCNIDKAVFVTDKNRTDMEDDYGYNQYNKFLISGNALERQNCRNINKIEQVQEKDLYRGIYLLRISKERSNDIDNLISFGEYLKQNSINNIVIDVFGDGDYVDEFLDKLEEKDLMDVINYKGKTNNPTHHIRHHDVLVDFSINHSFGMTYIEGILNGKMVYCMKNPGSLEVMSDISDAFITSNEDLVKKINNLPNITVETLQENYRKVESKYSRSEVASKFIEFLKE